MAIYKSNHSSNYSVIPNEILNSKLSLEAIGLLVSLLSLPKSWVIHKSVIHKHYGMGREKMERIFSELSDAGYFLSIKRIDPKTGHFTYEHIVYDKPYNDSFLAETKHLGELLADNEKDKSPLVDPPLSVKPSTINPTTYINTNEVSKQVLSKKLIKDKKIKLFELFWDLYDKKSVRPKCEKVWLKLEMSVIEKILSVVPEYIKSTPDKQFRKNPLTWLNNECWNDEIIARTNIQQQSQQLKNITPTYD